MKHYLELISFRVKKLSLEVCASWWKIKVSLWYIRGMTASISAVTHQISWLSLSWFASRAQLPPHFLSLLSILFPPSPDCFQILLNIFVPSFPEPSSLPWWSPISNAPMLPCSHAPMLPCLNDHMVTWSSEYQSQSLLSTPQLIR